MGYRLGAEERFAPRDLTNLIPTYDPSYAHRTTDKVTQYAREQEERSRLLSQLGTEEIIKGPIKAYQAQADRNRAAAESDQQMRLRDRAGALTEEQIKSAAQARGLSEKFGERKAQAEIGSYEQQMNAAQRQLKNAEIEGNRLEEESKFLAQPAANAGFKDALPGETIRAYNLRNGIEGGRQDRLLKQAQIAENLSGQNINKINAEIARENLLVAQSERTTNDLVARLSMTDDPMQQQAIIDSIVKDATPAQVARAFMTIKSNKQQSQYMAEQIARLRPESAKMAEAYESGSTVSSIVAEADNAINTYGGAKTRWSPQAEDAVNQIKTQLRAAGFEQQAAEFDSTMNVGFMSLLEDAMDAADPNAQVKSRQDKLREAVNQMKRSLGASYKGKYGSLGKEYSDFGTAVQAQSYGSAMGADGKARNVFLGQQSESLAVPLPSARFLPQQQPQQMQMAGQQMLPNQPTNFPWLQPKANGTAAPQPVQQQMQQTPPQAPQAPQFQLPASFKPVRQLGQQ